MKKILKIYNNDKYKRIHAKFVIPKPNMKSILLSKKLQGGVLMDMGPYISSIPRLFKLKKLIKKKIRIINNKEKLIISIKFLINFEEGEYRGIFKFGDKYKNEIKVSNGSIKSLIGRVFSPPDNEFLILKTIYKKKKKIIKFRKDNCFRNFFTEVLKIINERKYDFYYKRMIHDVNFRTNLNKKIIY